MIKQLVMSEWWVIVVQSSLTLCDPMDWSPPGSSVHRISQARILEWVAISFPRGSSRPRDRTCISCIGRWTLEPLSHQGSPFFVLEVDITTIAFFWLVLAWYILFYLFFNLFISCYFKCVTCRHHLVESCFINAIFLLLGGVYTIYI